MRAASWLPDLTPDWDGFITMWHEIADDYRVALTL